MKILPALFALMLSLPAPAQTISSGGKLRPEQAIMDIRHYTISLNINFEEKSIAGFTQIDVIMAKPTHTLMFDLLDSLDVSAVLVNHKKVTFDHRNNLITAHLMKELPVGKAVVEVVYAGKPHIALDPPWADGFTWTTDSTGHPWLGISEESIGGKLYFPCKDHPSDEPNEGVDMRITVPADLTVSGPGLLKKTKKNGHVKTYRWVTNYTINNYDIVFAVGDYALVSRKFHSVSGKTIPLEFYVLNEHFSKAAHHLDIFERTIHEQEKYFGEYPWANEKIGICETPFEGMEHQTMNAYGNKFAYTKVGGQDYDLIMHHELGHEWWGNKVSVKDWADYWIQEGICTFGDALYLKEFGGNSAYIDFFQNWAPLFKNKIPVVRGINIDAVSAYQNSDIYFKGAFFMHTLSYIIGDSVFLSALKRFVNSPKYTYDNLVSTADLQAYFSHESGQDLKPLFDLYLYSTNKLEIHVKQHPRGKYLVQLENINMPLPIDISTDTGTRRMIVDNKGITVESTTMPLIDKDTYYLKKVTYE